MIIGTIEAFHQLRLAYRKRIEKTEYRRRYDETQKLKILPLGLYGTCICLVPARTSKGVSTPFFEIMSLNG